jgi:hypothetical protein
MPPKIRNAVRLPAMKPGPSLWTRADMSFLHAQNEKGRFEFPLCGGDGMTTKESPEISGLKACESYR